MKEYSAYLKAPALLEPHHRIILCHIQDTCLGWGLTLCRGAIGVFFSPNMTALKEFSQADTEAHIHP